MTIAKRQCSQPQLYTIGYAGHTPESFIQTLQSQGVRLLLDIRLSPISRKKGFSKTALSKLLKSAGIDYAHVRKLGSPRSLREQLYTSGDYDAFFDLYRAYLVGQDESMAEALEMVRHDNVCLMCVEAEPHECHRNVVADAIAARLDERIAIKHIPAPSATHPRKAKSVQHLSQSEPQADRISR